MAMAEKQEPAKPVKPQGLQPLKDLELDEQQWFTYGFRQIEMFLEKQSAFSTWLAEHGRAT
jgi:hypothetical protein